MGEVPMGQQECIKKKKKKCRKMQVSRPTSYYVFSIAYYAQLKLTILYYGQAKITNTTLSKKEQWMIL